MTTWFTSDLHLGHANIIKYSKRPFSSVEEMDQMLISNWNSVVGEKDSVYIVGDFAFYKDQQKTLDTLQRLNGVEKHLIFGNHDRYLKSWVLEKFTSATPYKEIYVQDLELPTQKQFIVLCHYAFRVFNKSHYGSWNLYGHSHGSLPDDPRIRSLDVGVDCWNYTPASYEQIKERMKLKTPIAVDHHGDRE